MARVIRSTNDAEYMAANRINSELAQRGTSIYGIVNLVTNSEVISSPHKQIGDNYGKTYKTAFQR